VAQFDLKSIHKNLVLDHMFFSANDEEFAELKLIFAQFQCVSHSVVQTDEDGWEGLYLRTRGQYYLEILRNRRIKSIGLCQKAYLPLSQDSRHIVNDFPNLPWKTFERSNKGVKWFTALSCDDYFNLETPFNTWVMYYHKTDDMGVLNIPQVEIEQITDVCVSSHPSLFDKIVLNSTWFNADKNIGTDCITYQIQTQYCDSFRLKIDLNNIDPGFYFNQATFKLHNNFNASEYDLQYYSFQKVGSNYVLFKKQ